jgi:hypothetical protein
VAIIAFLAPIQPGKRAQWDEFRAQLTGPRHADFNGSRRRHGVHERTFLQETPMGDVVILTIDGENPAKFLAEFAHDDDDFTR